MKIFILTGSLIGMTGTLIGAVLGVLFCQNIEAIRQFVEKLLGAELFNAEIYFLYKLPAELDWTEVWVVMGLAFVLTLFFTVLPAMKAGRVDPVEALRYE